VFTCTSNLLHANNGQIAYIYPISNITVDGKVDDWPTGIQRYSMDHMHYGEVDGPEDGSAYWMGGYDAKTGHLYIGVVRMDDDYVKTPDDGHYSTHDFQVLYIDPSHSRTGTGVIAYEIDEDHRKIVEQEGLTFYPQVKNASFDPVELVIKRDGAVITYEWKIKMDTPMTPGRVIGFDYAVFDKDTDQGNVMITWGPTEGNKFIHSNFVGDLVLLAPDAPLGTIKGQLKWKGKEAKQWPETIQFSHPKQENVFFNAAIDSLGRYELKLPPATYDISIPSTLQFNRWFDIDLIQESGQIPQVTIKANQLNQASPIDISLAPKPDLIPEKGILHTPFNAQSSQQVDAFVKAYQDYYKIPAVSLALIQNGELAYYRSYGVENTATNTPLRNKAVFEAASITKLIFAYSVNRLVQRGDYDLDQPLHESLPFTDLEKEYPDYKLMTGKHVLTHVSGLPNWGRRLNNKPGTTFGYSGEGFEYLKRVIAAQAGEEMPSFIQSHMEKEVLNPLGITNTYFACNPQLPNLKVAGHTDGLPSMYDCPEVPGMAFSMHTEAKDFIPFALALLNREGLTEEQAADMFTFHTLEAEEDWYKGYKSGYGLGVALRESPHGLVFGHGGNNGDFRCIFEMYDDLKSGYILFTNANTAGPLLFDVRDFLVEGKKAK